MILPKKYGSYDLNITKYEGVLEYQYFWYFMMWEQRLFGFVHPGDGYKTEVTDDD